MRESPIDSPCRASSGRRPGRERPCRPAQRSPPPATEEGRRGRPPRFATPYGASSGEGSISQGPATLGTARERVKVRQRLLARRHEPKALGFPRALEQPADGGAGRDAEALHDVLAPDERRRGGADLLRFFP